MPKTIEVIDGQDYLVTRDDAGNLISMEGRSTASPLDRQMALPQIIKNIMDKPLDTITIRDLAVLMFFIVRRLHERT